MANIRSPKRLDPVIGGGEIVPIFRNKVWYTRSMTAMWTSSRRERSEAMKRMKSRIAVLVAMFATVSAANMSGRVVLPSGAGLAGVGVVLRKAGAATTTDAQGRWSLATTGVLSRASGAHRISNGLFMEGGRLFVRLDGFAANGRQVSSGSMSIEPMAAARGMAGALDTLVFSRRGAEVARLAIGTLDTAGIVMVIDTGSSVGAIDPGTTTTQWASGCSQAKVPCTAGTWVAGGPDPDHTHFKLIKESAHFAIYSDEAISDAVATSALNTLETQVWENMFNSNLYMPEPWCKQSTKIKAAIHVHSGWGLTGGGWTTNKIGMWISPNSLNDVWGLTHEFTHGWQTANGQLGGMACRGTNTCGWVHESHAEYIPHQLPQFQSRVNCSEMLFNTPHMYLGSTRNRYCNWQFMEYLKDKHCPSAVNEMWTVAGDDPFTSIQKSRGWSISQLNDFFGDWAMHNVVWDYKGTPGAFRSAYGNITLADRPERRLRLMPLEALNDSWATNRRFVVPFYGAPQRFGYNVVRLFPEAGAASVTVKFRGVNQTGSNADFRWGLVATNATFTTARYSAMQKGLDANLTFKVNAGEPLFLVVTATPSVFQTITWDQDYNTIWRFPYMVELANAWPQGFQNGVREACPTGTQRHANGGGCAPASTPATVFVGPYAKILTGATVTGNARIEDQATILRGTVTGGTVGGLTILNDFTVSGSATVRTTFYPMGHFEGGQSATGTVNIYGDVEMRGDGTSRNSGNLTGFIDATSRVGSATDRNSKGPWSWRP
jgi:hypothetical protein